MPDWPHERNLYRIEYPRGERPGLRIGGALHDVVDCSEQGLRFVLEGEAWAPGRVVQGILALTAGEVPVKGRILRIQEGEAALLLDAPGIPFSLILEEQRYLRGKYPMWPGSREGR